MRKLTITFSIVCLVFVVYSQQWKPVEAPLMTSWANDIDASRVLPEYPRPQMERTHWMNLNGIWQFQEAEPGGAAPFGKKLSDRILVPFPWESALSGVRKQLNTQTVWYRREFSIPDDWRGENILLHFGAVDWKTEVYVNGKFVGQHKGGYDQFTFDITVYLKHKGKQELVIKVFDPGRDQAIARGKQDNRKFDDPQRYTYCPSSGIWQTVWVEPVGPSYITYLSMIPDIDQQTVSITVNAVGNIAKKYVEVTVKDHGKIVANDTGTLNRKFDLKIMNSKLWSPESPFLYDVEIDLRDSFHVNDHVKSYLGMRKISIKRIGNIQRIELNNQTLFQMGVLDQGFWPDGIYTAPTDEALRWDVENIKGLGFNMIRKHIKVEPQRWYYWCDKLGILVWQDMPSTFGTRTQDEKIQFESELSQMVCTHINHPSIVNWIVFNEHWGLYDVERLTNNVKALDPSRLVTGNSGIDAGKPPVDYEVGDIKDNHSYRPPSVPFASDKRAVVNGEFGAIGYKVAGHVWDTDGPWVHYNYTGEEAATEEYERFIGMIVGFQKKGLSASVYTQWTDVENEMNGLYTYDRKIAKLDTVRIRKANLSLYKQ